MLTTIDIVFGIIILIAVIRCSIRGFVTEFLSVAALVFGIGGAILFADEGALYVEQYLGLTNWSKVISFLLIFIIIYGIVKILEVLLGRLLEGLHLEKLDRALGFFLGIVEGFLLVAVIVLALQLQPFFEVDDLINTSYIATFILRIIPYGIDLIEKGEVPGSV